MQLQFVNDRPEWNGIPGHRRGCMRISNAFCYSGMYRPDRDVIESTLYENRGVLSEANRIHRVR